MTKKQKKLWYIGIVIVLLGLGMIFVSCNKDKAGNPASPASTGEGKSDLIASPGDGSWGAYYGGGLYFLAGIKEKGDYQLEYGLKTGKKYFVTFETPEAAKLQIGLKAGDQLDYACIDKGKIIEAQQTAERGLLTSWKVIVHSYKDENGNVPWWQSENGAEMLFTCDANAKCERTCVIENGTVANGINVLPPLGGGGNGGTNPPATTTTTNPAATTTTTNPAATTTTTAVPTTTTTSTTTTSTTTTTTTTTTTNPCPGGSGVQVTGSTACWYLGAVDEACSDANSAGTPTSGTCFGKGQYHDDTASFAGQAAATNAGCETVLTALLGSAGAVTDNGAAGTPYDVLGCGHYDPDSSSAGPTRTRYTQAATTHDGSTAGDPVDDEVQRACGCTQ